MYLLGELITHAIKKLAPDQEVLEYINESIDKQGYMSKGRPTRRGRLKYICRKIDMDGYSTFLNADTTAALGFIDLLQEGTHSLEKPFSQTQMKALLNRAEGLISFLIDVGNA